MIEKAYAKINITLEIVGKNNNYHLLESIITPIDIYDTLTFEISNKDELISNVNIKNNNIYEAINLFKETYKINKSVKVTLDKKIPIGYGLGGSSADISATLRGLNKLFNLNKPLKELENLALKLGSDTLFCLYQKRALVTGRGDFINIKEKEEKDNILLILPNEPLLTKGVFKNYIFNNTYIDFKDAFYNDDFSFINKNMKNDLLNSALELNKTLKELYFLLKEEGFNVNLTGSGPALFMKDIKEEQVKIIKELVNKSALVIITKEI